MDSSRNQVVSIVDYGICNLGSIRNMLHKLGIESRVAGSAAEVALAEKIILPGVGAFDHGITALRERGMVDALRESAIGRRVPFLGICLGMQLFGSSTEEGTMEGLGLIPGRCVRFRPAGESTLKVPHMGWNEIVPRRACPLLRGLEQGARFYFTHSYHMICEDAADVLAVASHGIEFTAMVQRGNVLGAQFHPEKSHRFGMTLLRNFGAL
jgi:glutamine amidotransferase